MRKRRQMRLREFLVFGFGLTEYRDIRVRVFPSGEELIVGFAAVLTVPLHGIGPRETELRQRSKHYPLGPSAITDELLELGGSLGVLSCSQVSFRTVIKNLQCGLFVLRDWNEQIHAEFAEVLEKVHVLFRTAKRHDMLGSLTATRRAAAAESLAVCEQVFRVLLDKEYAKARRLLELHSDLLPSSSEVDPSSIDSLLLGRGQVDTQSKEVEGTVDPPM